MPIVSGAEPYSHDGGDVGVLLCHGFTGSPGSLRPWGEHLASQGFSVSVPRWPGHGTTWQEMSVTRWDDWLAAAVRALDELSDRCSTVVVGGLSMGGALALRLAQVRHDAVHGLTLVNPAVHSDRTDMKFLPVLKSVIPSMPGISNDIKRPGQDEVAYTRVPLKALHSLTVGWKQIKADIAEVDQPLLVFRSQVDHVVEASNTAWILDHVSSTDVEERVLLDSFHVATLDNDASEIFTASTEFVRRLTPAATGR